MASFGKCIYSRKASKIDQNRYFGLFFQFPGETFETNHDLNPNKVNAIVDDHAFKTTAMLLFKKTMLLLTNIANENPELLKNIPEFLCQNINDVTGLLRFVTNV